LLLFLAMGLGTSGVYVQQYIVDKRFLLFIERFYISEVTHLM